MRWHPEVSNPVRARWIPDGLGACVQVCDFNLSRVMEETAVLSSMAATNPRWLAPEILAGRGYTFSSDIYSFGIILWEFLTWRVPWHEYGPWQVRHAAVGPAAIASSGSSYYPSDTREAQGFGGGPCSNLLLQHAVVGF